MSCQFWINDICGVYLFSWYVVLILLLVEWDWVMGYLFMDVVVIGVGYIGFYVVLMLCSKGLDVVVLDVYCVGWGVFGCNGGQVGIDFNKDVLWFEKCLGCDMICVLWLLVGEVNKMVCDFCWMYVFEVNFCDGIVYGEISVIDLEDVWCQNDYLVEYYDVKLLDIFGLLEFVQIVKID